MIRRDYKRYKLSFFKLLKGFFTGHCFFAVLNYRVSSWLRRRRIGFFPEVIQYMNKRQHGCEISSSASISDGFLIHHSVGIVIGHAVIIGKNFECFQNVTIGSNRKEKNGQVMPVIGDNVSIGTGSVVVGPIKIGNNVVIGAGSYVDKDIPDNTFYYEKRERIYAEIKKEWD